ncbi:unnamed protein product [Owenia fusiformis]|uniref:Uncharacterized protein n=1 Tax=Owenia fusiformis TaxID=6347 RepID=A0A8J1Y9N3_OWEFU|nr:unnamed protein product [Owenia fusiformis]
MPGLFSSLKSFTVVINHKDNDQNCPFKPGDVIDGTVEIDVKNSINATSLEVNLIGEAVVTFKKWYHSFWDREEEAETVLELSKVLWKRDQEDGTKETLPLGHHSFPFKFRLPKSLPSTFKFFCGSPLEWNSNVNGGQIEYHASAHINLKTHFGEKKIPTKPNQMEFLVKRPVNLDKKPELFKPAEASGEKQIFCAGGKIELNVQLEKTGFTEGEPVKLSLSVNNNSRSTVKKVKLVLEKRMYFRYLKRTKMKCTKQLVELNVPLNVPKGEVATTSNRQLIIPGSTEHSKMKGIDNIDVRYKLVATVPIFGQSPVVAISGVTIGERDSNRAL